MTFFGAVGGVDALVLIDTDSTVNAVSHEFTTVSRLETVALSDPITLQLGCSGSRSHVNFGAKTTITVQGESHDVYFDVANIDHYDVILGIPFMDEFGMIINFQSYTIQFGDLVLSALKGGGDHRRGRKGLKDRAHTPKGPKPPNVK